MSQQIEWIIATCIRCHKVIEKRPKLSRARNGVWHVARYVCDLCTADETRRKV